MNALTNTIKELGETLQYIATLPDSLSQTFNAYIQGLKQTAINAYVLLVVLVVINLILTISLWNNIAT